MGPWSAIVKFGFAEGVARRSLIIALVVGTILNLINQGDALVAGRPLDWFKIGLTFCVPYCVATYGAVSLALAKSRAETRGEKD